MSEPTYYALRYWRGVDQVWRVLELEERGYRLENIADWRGLHHVAVNRGDMLELELEEATRRIDATMPAPVFVATMREDAAPYARTEWKGADEECEYCYEWMEWRDSSAHYHAFYVTREGASTRTADELARVFLEDVAGITTYVIPADMPDPNGWLEDADESELLSDEIRNAESALGDVGLFVEWDDGYRIESRIELETCAVCGELLEEFTEEHAHGWLDATGDALSYVPTLHNHAPAVLEELEELEEEGK